MNFRRVALDALLWLLSPMDPPWERREGDLSRWIGEAAGVVSLATLFGWLREEALNVELPRYELLAWLGLVGLPVVVALGVRIIPWFRELNVQEALLTSLWIQRGLAVQLVLLGSWATVLIVSGTEPDRLPFFGQRGVAYWTTAALVVFLAFLSMKKTAESEQAKREVAAALMLYATVVVVLWLVPLPRFNEPWYLYDVE